MVIICCQIGNTPGNMGFCHDLLISLNSLKFIYIIENSYDKEILLSRANEEKKEFLSIQKAPRPQQNLFIKYTILGSIDFAQIVNQKLTY